MPSEQNDLLRLYQMMLVIRHAEEEIVGPVVDCTVKCPCHLYSGQEAVAVGVCANLTCKDFVFGNHRSHGHYLAMGGDLEAMFAEIYGASSGCAGGRGGSMHLISLEHGMMGAAPIVAGTISLALGAALACSIRGGNQVAVSFFGDGSTGEGVLYESLNFAALKKLPIVFVCENNFYSTHMSVRECRPDEEIADIAKPFGIVSERVDGNDLLKVRESARRAIARCRRGEGPAFLEYLTYRLRGHVGPDDNVQGTHTDIRPQDEIERWKLKDPIVHMKQTILKSGVHSERIREAEEQAKSAVEVAHAAARAAAKPAAGELLHYVFK
jgi:pyruvate dehydrogenase E1 component alpha subunit